MKIAINIEHFLEAKGGAERYAAGLAYELVEHGHDVHILAFSWDEGCEKYFHCHRIPHSWFRTWRDVKFVRAAQREFLKGNFDLCLSFSRSLNTDIYHPHGGVHKAYLKRELESIPNPFVKFAKMLFKAISLRHFLIKKVEKAIFSKQNVIIVAISEMVKRDILSFYPILEESIKVIYNGVDMKRFNLDQKKQYRKEIRSRYSVEEKDFLIMFVANNFRLKGLRNLIYAAALMKREMKSGTPFYVFVLGNGKKAFYERLAMRLGCWNEFTFIGKINEIEKFYAAADVLALPTFYDPCSLSTIEAMASGLPVITTICNGAGELVKNGVHGFVLDNPQDWVELSKKLLLFFDRNLRKKMSANAHQAAKDFSVQRNAREMLLLCEDTVRMKQ